MGIRVGQRATHVFVIDDASMRAFQAMSGDTSRVHTDSEFARSRGYRGVIAYGAIMLAHLSHVLGMKLPGPGGVSTRWTVNYREPLYVGESAEISLEVTHTSKDLGIVESKFRINAQERVIATGSTQTLVPPDEIDE